MNNKKPEVENKVLKKEAAEKSKKPVIENRVLKKETVEKSKKPVVENRVLKSGTSKRYQKAGAERKITGKKRVEKQIKAAGKPDFRLLIMSVMGIFVLFVGGWGVCQMIKSINTKGQLTTYEEVQSIKKIEDNSENAGKTINVDGLVKKVLDKVAFEAELNKLDDSVAEGMIDTTEGTRLQFYVGSGTFADELIVMTAKNEKDAKQNQENAKTHLAETRKAFQDYIPKEAEKIDKAVSVRCGCYVIVCVTADYETAEETINALIQK